MVPDSGIRVGLPVHRLISDSTCKQKNFLYSMHHVVTIYGTMSVRIIVMKKKY